MEPRKRPLLSNLSGWSAVGVVVLALVAFAVLGLVAGGWTLWFQ
jgi:hypothetical protein